MKIHWQGEIIFMDGLCLINEIRLISEIFIIIMSLLIIITIGIQNINIKSELYLILLSNLIGISYLITSNDWIITITSWELLNLSLYLLVTMQIYNKGASLSAGLKYFLLSALTTAFLLMGVTLIYGKTGTTNMDVLNSFQYFLITDTSSSFPLILPYLLIFITFSFKLGAAPFHNWAPDLYDAIPTPLVMWMAIIPKLSLLLILLSFVSLFLPILNPFIIFIALTSLFIGSIGLGSQWRIKRFFAYSAISHIGYLFLTYTSLSFDTYLYYLFIYSLTSFLFFAILLAIQSSFLSDFHSLKQLSGLFLLNPSLSLAFSLCLFSLAGIPPLAGFFAKLQILQALLSNSSFYLALFLILTSVISTANYLSIIKISHFDLPLYPLSLSITPFLSSLISILSSFLLFFYLKPHSLLLLSSFLYSSSLV